MRGKQVWGVNMCKGSTGVGVNMCRGSTGVRGQ